MASDRGVYNSVLCQAAVHNRTVFSGNGMHFELIGNALMCFVIFADDQGTGRVAVDAVYDPRTKYTVDAGKGALTVIKHSIDQCAGVMTGGRMHYHSLWLVHDEQIVILIEDVEWNVFRFGGKFFRFWHRQKDPVSGRKLCADFCRGAVYEHGSVFDQPLEAGSGEIRKLI